MPLLQISIDKSKELQTTIALLETADKSIAKDIDAASKRDIDPVWQDAVAGKVHDKAETAVLGSTARTLVGPANVRLRTGWGGQTLSGGGTVQQLAGGTEFGSNGRYKQFGPRRKAGPTYDAAAKTIPKIASIWAKVTIASFLNLFPDKEG
jgi:hypothetical protein